MAYQELPALFDRRAWCVWASQDGGRIVFSDRDRTAHVHDVVAESVIFSYPGWVVEVDGRPTPTTPAPVSGMMRFPVPAGDHDVVLRLETTPWRRAAGSLSLGALALLGLATAFARWRRRAGI